MAKALARGDEPLWRVALIWKSGYELVGMARTLADATANLRRDAENKAATAAARAQRLREELESGRQA